MWNIKSQSQNEARAQSQDRISSSTKKELLAEYSRGLTLRSSAVFFIEKKLPQDATVINLSPPYIASKTDL
jgi:hypothetical protein